MPNSRPIQLQPNLEPEGAGLGTMLCADVACTKRCAPTVAQVAALINGDNELSSAIETKIAGVLREYAGERFAAQASRMDAIECKIDLQADATKRVEASTAGLVELMNSWTGAMRTIEMTGKVLKPLSWIAGFFTALLGLWAAVRGFFGG
jgi:hypothetical protein